MAAGQSRPIDRILNIFVSAAAVPVLLGALFKITHAPGADTWLKIGLYVEAGIFLGYALLYVFLPHLKLLFLQLRLWKLVIPL